MSHTRTLPRMLSAAEIASRLSVSPRWVRSQIARGAWPARRIGGLVRVPEAALVLWLERQPAAAGVPDGV
jgi:excisionase family DNA binding protein